MLEHKDPDLPFHQMNAAWNTVNAGIAYFGYRGEPFLTRV